MIPLQHLFSFVCISLLTDIIYYVICILILYFTIYNTYILLTLLAYTPLEVKSWLSVKINIF